VGQRQGNAGGQGALAALAAALGQDPKALAERLAQANKEFIYLVRG
jgi:CO/xanthine dehydrogenase Mo-binding subunit